MIETWLEITRVITQRRGDSRASFVVKSSGARCLSHVAMRVAVLDKYWNNRFATILGTTVQLITDETIHRQEQRSIGRFVGCPTFGGTTRTVSQGLPGKKFNENVSAPYHFQTFDVCLDFVVKYLHYKSNCKSCYFACVERERERHEKSQRRSSWQNAIDVRIASFFLTATDR